MDKRVLLLATIETKASEVQYMNTDSVKAAKSIVSERAVRDGIFGNAINVGFEIT